MNYTKPALSIENQILKLKERRLFFSNEDRAANTSDLSVGNESRKSLALGKFAF